ncbi:tRNA pseudouridine(55) synthase TruB [Staphylococcus chromogenes]|uniref:tRNA pseudouridine(55) synthase TruB n=1 Tax=Staphylococcus chromogenes TaxID=46126 RepID=UPI001C3D1596|nr:tRNA pseudouridine(55) synthase TruB [Staphylococcus chromogenes]MBV5190276.1 tRNA pseudouridine(55) synthase TruB [Staphylococcus chromogenes]
MYHGILPVYKPRSMTSHDVVFKLRKILKTKKIGHTGTLDPEVDGVLPICIGQATKVSDYVMDMGKTYQAEITLGIATTTEDQTGEVLEQTIIEEGDVTNTQIDQVLASFQGIITQIPPMYSSVKVNGKKLYEYARRGETVERPARQVKITHIERLNQVDFDKECATFSIEVSCGKGTYIRTLATDIGKQLNLPAHMSRLTRLESGGFHIDQALSLERIAEKHQNHTLSDFILPMIYGLKALPMVYIEDKQLKQRISNGQKLSRQQFNMTTQNQLVFVDAATDAVIAIYEAHPTHRTEIKPKKVFN